MAGIWELLSSHFFSKVKTVLCLCLCVSERERETDRWKGAGVWVGEFIKLEKVS